MTIIAISLVAFLMFAMCAQGMDVVSAPNTSPAMTNVTLSAIMTSGTPPRPAGSSAGDTPLPRQAGGGSPGSGSETRFVPVLPEDIKLVGSVFPANAVTDWAASQRLRFFGWANGGYTWASTGSGLLAVEPRENRFGNEWLLDQTAFVLERTLAPEWSWGFRGEFYMGADAALLRPVNGFGSTNDKFGTDFRQAYLSIHAPVLTDGGIDFKFGRQYVPLGYETTMAPYRPIYSLSYAWLYAENGATTSGTATFHVDPDLDLIAGVTLGVNSLYELQGRAPDYILRGLYWLGPDKRTKLVGTFYTGPKPISSAKGHVGDWYSLLELQAIHDVNRRLTLVSENNMGWETRDPGNNDQTSQWYGTAGFAIIHVNRLVDVNLRAEWFYDEDGSRIGTSDTHYYELTSGLNIMPRPWLNFRPEIRWDSANKSVFGPESDTSRDHDQWTVAFDMLLKF